MLERWQKAGLLLPTLATVIVLAILAGLGTWQLERKAWKEKLLAEIAMRTAAPPIDIGDGVYATGPSQLQAYTRVLLRGRFLHDKERYWFADGRLGSGFEVFTPLETAPGHIVWIDRGYVPADRRDAATRPDGQITGTVTVTGLVHIPSERNRFTPPNDVVHNFWYWRDLPALTASAFSAGVVAAPVMVDAAATPANPGGWPEGGTTIVTLPNRHLEYVLTWYGLAVTLLVLFVIFARRRLSAVS